MTKTLTTLLAVLGLLFCASSAAAATSFELGTGSNPDVDVDAAGTAHIVVDLPDEKLRYCQIPRGQTTCAVDKTLAPPAQATGRSSFVFVPSPGRVVIVSRRCCPPDGSVAYGSVDNGATFAGPTQISAEFDPEDMVFGPGDAVSALERSGWYQRMPLTGPGATTRAELPAGFTVPTGSSIALLDGTRPFKVSADGDNTTFSVQSGAGDPNSTGTWSAPTPVAPAGSEPHLASGTAGLAMIYRVGTELHARKWNGSAFDPHQALSTGDPIRADLTTGATGRFTALWIENRANQVRLATSGDGSTWSSPSIVLRDLPSDGLFNTQVATAPDGQGFAVFDSNSDSGKIIVTPLDPRSAVSTGGSGTKPIDSTTVNGTRISFFGPTSCIQRPKNIVLRVTSKRKRQLSPRRRVKITRVVFNVDRKKKTDRRKAFRKSFSTRRFRRGSRHRVGAVVRLAPVKKGAFKKKTKRLKGRFRMCRT